MADVKGGQDIEIASFANLTPPSAVSDGTRAGVRLSRFGDILIGLVDPDDNYYSAISPLNEQTIASRQLIWTDYLGDQIETGTRWTSTTASGGTAVGTANGESEVQTSAAANGSAYIQSNDKIRYQSGSIYEWGVTLRCGDTGVANNIRAWGIMTMSGTAPQNGYYFELNGTTLNIVSAIAGSLTRVASGSWTRNGTAPFTLDTNYHRYEIVFGDNIVLFYIDGILRHILPENNIASPRTATLLLPITIQTTNTTAATNETLFFRGTWIAKYGDVKDTDTAFQIQNKVAQYTSTQTSTALWTPSTLKRVVVTSVQIQAGGTTAGTLQVYFGSGAYSRGTSRTIFDGEFAPSSTLKPGVILNAPSHGWIGNPDDVLRVTDSAAINPLTVNVWGYED